MQLKPGLPVPVMRTLQSAKEIERGMAVALAIEVLGLETQFRNYYECQVCEVDWIDTWSCGCDDECPECGVDISPIMSVEIDADGNEIEGSDDDDDR